MDRAGRHAVGDRRRVRAAERRRWRGGTALGGTQSRGAPAGRRRRLSEAAHHAPELAPLMPGNVRITYNMTAAAAHLGDVTAAFAGLDALCDMGLSFDLTPTRISIRCTPTRSTTPRALHEAQRAAGNARSPVARARRAGSAARRHRLRSDVATVFVSSIRTIASSIRTETYSQRPICRCWRSRSTTHAAHYGRPSGGYRSARVARAAPQAGPRSSHSTSSRTG